MSAEKLEIQISKRSLKYDFVSIVAVTLKVTIVC